MPKIHNLERDTLDYWRQHTTEYLNDILKLTDHFKSDKRIGSRRLLIQFVINERAENRKFLDQEDYRGRCPGP